MCIPINAVKPLIERVLSGEIEAIAPVEKQAETESTDDLTGKPRMGISIANVNSSSRAAMLNQIPDGVFITEVEAGGPAEQAGLQAGDIIVDVNDVIITDTDQLIDHVGQYKAGDVLKVKVYRAEGLLGLTANDDAPEGEYIDVEVTLAIVDTPAEEEAEESGFLYDAQ